MSGESGVAAGSGCDLFVSYATSDAREIAENVVVDLERRGLKCWIAPRDIPAGTRSWAAEIVRSIRDSDNFLLLLSEAANASEEIEKELSEAARHRKTVFVIRVSDIEPSDGLGYHLNRVQWRDLFRNREDVLNEVAGRVIALREAKVAANAARPAGPVAAALDFSRHTQPVATAAPAALPPKKSPLALIAAGIAGLAVVGLGAVLLLRPASPPPESAAEQRQRLEVEKAALEKAQAEKLAQDRQKAREQVVAVMTPHLPAGYAVNGIVDRFWQAQEFRALAVAPGFGGNFSSGLADEAEAIRIAVESCQILYPRAAQSCAPVAVNSRALANVGQPLPSAGQTRVSYSGSFDPAMVAAVSTKGGISPGLIAYRDAASPKAMALHPFGRFFTALGRGDQRRAELNALAECEAYARSLRVFAPCFLYAAGDEVVLASRATEPLTLQMASIASPPLAGSAPMPGSPAPGAPAAAIPMPASAPAATPGGIGDFRASVISAIRAAAPDYAFAERQTDRYLSGRANRALAVARPSLTWRSTGAPSPEEAVASALEGCSVSSRRECELLASNDELKSLAAFPGVREMAARRVAYDGPFDPAMIPVIWSTGRRNPSLVAYGAAAGHKAMALSPTGIWNTRVGAESARDAEMTALRDCNEQVRRLVPEPLFCFLYASGDRTVLKHRYAEPVSTR